jgi:hypothetical protein
MDELLRVGKAMGLNPRLPPEVTGMGKQADSLWRALDQLSARDPAAYEAYLASVRAEVEASARGGGGGGGGAAAAAPQRGLVPQPGYCVWVRPRGEAPAAGAEAVHLGGGGAGGGRPPRQLRPAWLGAGAQLYVNVCYHERADAPKTAAGQPAPQAGALDLQALLNLNIPLALSPVRRLGSGAPAVGAIDVIANPFIRDAVARESAFKHEYTAFVLGAVADELELELPQGTWVEEPCASVPYKGLGGDGLPVPFPTAPAPSAAEQLGVGGGGRKKGAAAAAAAAAGGGGGGGAAAELSDLLRHLETSSSALGSGGAAGEEEALGGLAALQAVGKRLEGGGGGGSAPAPAPAAPAPADDAAAAADFARFVSASLPQAALLYSAAVAGVAFTVLAPRALQVRVTFDAARVAVGAEGFLAQADLQLAPARLSLSLPSAFLPGYDGLRMDSVPVLAADLPQGLQCLPGSARAKLSKRAGTLTVTCELQE